MRQIEWIDRMTAVTDSSHDSVDSAAAGRLDHPPCNRPPRAASPATTKRADRSHLDDASAYSSINRVNSTPPVNHGPRPPLSSAQFIIHKRIKYSLVIDARRTIQHADIMPMQNWASIQHTHQRPWHTHSCNSCDRRTVLQCLHIG